MRFLISIACLLNVAWAEHPLDEVIRGMEESERNYDEEMRRIKRDKVELPDWAQPGYEERKLREQQIESDRLQEQTYRFQMLDQMERLNKNLEGRHRR